MSSLAPVLASRPRSRVSPFRPPRVGHRVAAAVVPAAAAASAEDAPESAPSCVVSEPSEAQKMIEVERKYGAPADLKAAITTAEGTLTKSIIFGDTYYDTPNCDLAAKDVWLRRREKQWEIKIPVEGEGGRSGGERSVFREVEGARSVADELAAALGLPAPSDGGDGGGADGEEILTRVMADAAARPFAEFVTERVSWSLDGASIDFDHASFGHSVVEVEVMCERAEQVEDAEKKVEEVAAKLGLEPLTETGGKLETFIRKNCPKHLAVLVSKGYLKP